MDLRNTDMLFDLVMQTVCHRFFGFISFVNSAVMPNKNRFYVANMKKKKEFLLFLGNGSRTDKMLFVFEQQVRTLKKRIISARPCEQSELHFNEMSCLNSHARS